MATATPVSALAIVQARMSSTRLPGKVLADVEGEPMLALLVRRLAQARAVGEIRLATSVLADDDAIEMTGQALGVAVHRGSLDNVLERFVQAAADHTGPIVRITADCPLIDPTIVDAVVGLFAATPGCAYASNVDQRTYPDGLDVEVIAREALLAALDETTDPIEREHVTGVVRSRPDRWLAAGLVHAGEDLAGLRWTVDTPDDLAFVRAVTAALGERRHTATLDRILDIVRADARLAAMPGGQRA